SMTDSQADTTDSAGTPPGDDEQNHYLFGAPDPVRLHLPDKIHIGEDDSHEAITEKLRRQGVKIGKGMIAPRVFWPALIVIVAVAVLSIVFPTGAGETILGI
ncbi:hypothetical protein, partial [Burkholderia multivorans]|uniref:hypothetical protein n=1 Tax=Burkholderia multivorans TaxID=87883 RepID=UPI001C657854